MRAKAGSGDRFAPRRELIEGYDYPRYVPMFDQGQRMSQADSLFMGRHAVSARFDVGETEMAIGVGRSRRDDLAFCISASGGLIPLPALNQPNQPNFHGRPHAL